MVESNGRRPPAAGFTLMFGCETSNFGRRPLHSCIPRPPLLLGHALQRNVGIVVESGGDIEGETGVARGLGIRVLPTVRCDEDLRSEWHIRSWSRLHLFRPCLEFNVLIDLLNP